MSAVHVADVGACVFDAYGTLFDIASVAKRNAELPPEKAAELSKAWRFRQTSYTWLLTSMGVYRDFWRITEDALDVAMAECGLRSEQLRARLLAQYRLLDAYPDVIGALTRLRERKLRTAILSNGTPEMLATAVSASKIGDLLDRIFSIHPIEMYKPHPQAYQIACDELDLSPRRILFVSSNYWDVSGASSFGFQVIWLNRTGAAPEPLPGKPTAVIRGLDALSDLITD